MQIEIPVSQLSVGDVIVDRQHEFRVDSIEECPVQGKGVAKVHVNVNLCYDTIARVIVKRNRREA